jgi:hypothetical protein
MTTLYEMAKLPGAARLDELNRLLRSNRMTGDDLALTLGMTYAAIRRWFTSQSPVPNAALITLAALERLPVAEREQLIARKQRGREAASTCERLAASIAARPPLSAKQAGATR